MQNRIDKEIKINFDSLLKQGLAVIDVRYRNYEVSDETFKYIVIQVDKDRETFYQTMLKHYLGLEFKEKQIFPLWICILKHKLQMSDTLGRDISIKVAALDYVETHHFNGETP
ncbi:MAG: hypothetical protein K8R90_08380 [Candidatus Cloacimonetes bacterium]|nr:hypothetical protein [Candidatus Cloacimonadota bacterium]